MSYELMLPLARLLLSAYMKLRKEERFEELGVRRKA